jgi:hypothetical protein
MSWLGMMQEEEGAVDTNFPVLLIHEDFTVYGPLSGTPPDTVNTPGDVWHDCGVTIASVNRYTGRGGISSGNYSEIMRIDAGTPNVRIEATALATTATNVQTTIYARIADVDDNGTTTDEINFTVAHSSNIVILRERIASTLTTLESISFNPPENTQYLMELEVVGGEARARAFDQIFSGNITTQLSGTNIGFRCIGATDNGGAVYYDIKVYAIAEFSIPLE